MQSKARKLKRTLSGQQNPGFNSSKIGGGDGQIVILKKGKYLPEKEYNKLDADGLVAYGRQKNKVFTKLVRHND